MVILQLTINYKLLAAVDV